MSLHQTSSYDQLPYTSTVMPYAQPERMAIIATLFGLQPPPIQHCRVLELGCADGSNLIAAAKMLPQADCWGVDLSARQIEDGQATIKQLGLSNLTLQQANITDIDDSFGQFDYVIAHGIYSWIEPEVQAHLLQVCQRNLTPNGIAYVSYNTYPGWHMRTAMREMLMYHTAPLEDEQQKVAQLRALLKFLHESTATHNDAYSHFLQEEFNEFAQAPAPYLFHEFLETHNEPLYFHQFVDKARQAGLEYLGDAHFHTMLVDNFPPPVQETLNLFKDDLVRQEQYMDFLRNRHFRHTLLCQQGAELKRAVTPAALEQFYISSALVPENANPPAFAEQQFVSSRGNISSNNPVVQVALRYLHQQFPLAAQLDELLAQVRSELQHTEQELAGDKAALANALFSGYASGLVDFHLLPSQFVNQPSDKPIASDLARLMAVKQSRIPNLRCELLNMQNVVARLILPLLDGQHDRASLLQHMRDWLQAGQLQLTGTDAQGNSQPLTAQQVDDKVLGDFLEEALQILARTAVLEK